MIWATVSSWSCFCWLYRASPFLTAKTIINLILVLTIWWCPCVESSLVLLEESVCYDQCVLLAKLYIVFEQKHFSMIHCVGPKFCLGFSVTSYRKNELTSGSTQYNKKLPKITTEIIWFHTPFQISLGLRPPIWNKLRGGWHLPLRHKAPLFCSVQVSNLLRWDIKSHLEKSLS